MKRRIYVMDCGNFIKIGVSINPDRRKNQIPHKVCQYYCTGPVENAFESERKMHSIYSGKRNKSVSGREYFDIPFVDAVKKLMEITEQKKDDAISGSINLKVRLVGGDGGEETERRINERIISLIPNMSDFDKGYILGKVESMAEQKKEDTEGKE
nr:MAG TPA: hypothetical protein [Caudoviricetes sp.]